MHTRFYMKGLILLLILGFLASFSVMGADVRDRGCKVKFIIGSVEVRSGAQVYWRPAKINMKLSSKDAVRTFVESSAEIETEEGTIIKVEENSTMELASVSENSKTNTSDTKVKMMSGKLWANVQKMTNSRSSFVFETPTATAAIRGTQLGLEVDKDGTKLKVYEGIVFVVPSGGGKGASVGANQQTIVKKGQKDVVIEKLKEEKKEDKGKDKQKTDTTKVDSTKTDTTKVDSAKTDTTKVDSTKKDTTKVDTSKSKVDTSKIDTSKTNKTKKDTTKTSFDNQGSAKPDTLGKTSKDTVAAAKRAPLILDVTSPSEGAVSSGGQISVTGKTTPGADIKIKGKPATVTTTGSFNASVDVPPAPGEYSIDVDAVLGTESKSVTRTIKVIPPTKDLILIVNTPKEGETYKVTAIPVSGVTASGAEITINGTKVPVTPTGGFSYNLLIPDEPGDYNIDIEATLEGAAAPKSVTRLVKYEKIKVPLTLTVISPNKGTLIKVSRVSVQGQTTGSEVTINGDPATVVNGQFNYNLLIGETRNWDITSITVVASNGDEEMTEDISVTVDHASTAVNTSAPMLTAILPRGAATTIASLPVSILDNTPDDEILFTSDIDGEIQQDNFGPKDKFVCTLLDGQHKYKFSATDMANNKSNVISWEGALIAKRPSIILRNPSSGTASIVLPPSPPQSGFVPKYTVEFEIKDLPNDDYTLHIF